MLLISIASASLAARPAPATTVIRWGQPGDLALPSHLHVGRTGSLVIFRPSTSTWFLYTLATRTPLVYQWGAPGDIPILEDFDGDGVDDLTVYRPSNGTWYILQSRSGFRTAIAISWGTVGDQPVPADYNADGQMDLAVFRPSTGEWLIRYAGWD